MVTSPPAGVHVAPPRTTDAPSTPPSRGPRWWRYLIALWQRAIETGERLPRWLRAGLGAAALALASFAGTNLGKGLQILVSKGPMAFVNYMQTEPFAPLARRYPVPAAVASAVLAVLVVYFIALKQRAAHQSQVETIIEGVEKARDKRHPPLDRRAARETYLRGIVERHNTLALPIGDVPLDTVAVSLPLERAQLATQDGRQFLNRPQRQRRKIEAADLDQALARTRSAHLVVLGEPDSGKTTLLNYEMVKQARKAQADADAKVPIHVSLPELAQSQRLDLYLSDVVAGLRIDPRYALHLGELIRQGEAFVCLDHLDRVEPERRVRLVELINREAVNDSIWVIGSRPDEYRPGAFQAAAFVEWKLQSLNKDLRGQLAKNLFPALEHLSPRPPSEEASGDAAVNFTSLLEDRLKEDAAAAEWGENPLLFSLLAVVYYRARQLPPNGAALYREVVDTVLALKESDSEPISRRLVRRVLADLALWLYQGKRRTFSLDDLLIFLWDVEKTSPLDVVSMARRITKLGMLHEMASERYSFRYEMFLDYLAAVAIAQRMASQDPSRHATGLQIALEHYPYGQWRDVLQLLVRVLVQEYGREGSRDALRWLRTLLRQEHEPPGDPGNLGLTLVLKSLAELEELPAAWNEAGDDRLAGDIAQTWTQALSKAAELGREAQQERLIALAPALAQLHGGFLLEDVFARLIAAFDDRNASVREAAALAVLAFSKQMPVDQVVKALRSGQPSERITAAWVLATTDDEAAQADLVDALDDSEWAVRLLALMTLGDKSPDERVTAALRDESEAVRLAAVAIRVAGKHRAPPSWLKALRGEIWPMVSSTLQDERRAAQLLAAKVGLEAIGVLVSSLVEPLAEQTATVESQVAGTAADTGSTPLQLAPPAQVGAPSSTTPGEAGNAEDTGGAGEQTVSDAVKRALEALGALDPAVLEFLVGALDDHEAAVRLAAVIGAGSLTLVGELESDLVGELTARLSDPTRSVRAAAVVFTALLEDESDAATRVLFEKLRDPEAAVRASATLMLGLAAAGEETWQPELGEPLLAALDDPSRWVNYAAALALLFTSEHAPLDALVQRLSDLDPAKRSLILVLLGLLGMTGPSGKSMPVKPLAKMLDDGNEQVRALAGLVLEGLGVASLLRQEDSLDLFTAPLEGRDTWMRLVGILALGLLGTLGRVDEERLVARLLGTLGDQYWLMRAAAVSLLAALAWRHKLEQPLLDPTVMTTLSDSQLVVRFVAVVALTVLSAEGKVSSPALVDGLARLAGDNGIPGDKSPLVRFAAVTALSEVATQGKKPDSQMLGHLATALHDSNWWVRVAAALSWVSASADAPAKKVAAALGDGDSIWVRLATAVLLAAEHQPDKLVPLLQELSSGKREPRHVINRALRGRRRGRRDPLVGVFRDKDPNRRMVAALAFALLDRAELLLGHDDDTVRGVAVLGLGLLGVGQALSDQAAVRRAIAAFPASVRSVASELEDGLLQLSQAMAPVLGKTPISVPIDRVTALVDDPHWAIGTAAVLEVGMLAAAGKLDDAAPAKRVVAALESKSLWVRMAAGTVLPLVGALDAFELEWTEAEALQPWAELGDMLSRGLESLGSRFGELISLDTLATSLASRAAWRRMLVVLLLGQAGAMSDTLKKLVSVDRLVGLREDTSVWVRAATMRALGQLGERAPVDVIVTGLHDRDRIVRFVALNALAPLGSKVPAESLLPALDDPEWFIRATAVEVLGARAPTGRLIAALRDPNEAVRAAAAVALGAFAQPAYADPLVAAFGDEEGYVRAITRSRDLIRQASAERSATGAATDDLESARAAARALKSLGEHLPIELVVAMLDNKKPSSAVSVRGASVLTLGLHSELVQQVSAGIHNPSWRVRGAAVLVLGVLGDRQAMRGVETAVQDPHPTVRRLALDTLWRVQQGTPTDPLAEPTGPEDSPERGRVAGALLSELGPYLSASVQRAMASVVERAASPTPEIVKRLEALLDWDAWEVRLKAAQSLAGIGQPVKSGTLKRLLDLWNDDHTPEEAQAAVDEALAVLMPLATWTEDE